MSRANLDKQPSPLFILINGAAATKTKQELAQMLGMCEATVRSRLRRPETMTLNELYRLCRLLHIPLEDLRQAITY